MVLIEMLSYYSERWVVFVVLIVFVIYKGNNFGGIMDPTLGVSGRRGARMFLLHRVSLMF